jgi:hypothetical protein
MGFIELKTGDRVFYIKELTLGDLRRYLSKAMKREFTADGSVREYFNTAESLPALINVCVYVEEGGSKRPLSEREADDLPADLALKLIDACFKANPSLAQGFPTQTP